MTANIAIEEDKEETKVKNEENKGADKEISNMVQTESIQVISVW